MKLNVRQRHRGLHGGVLAAEDPYDNLLTLKNTVHGPAVRGRPELCSAQAV